MKGDKRRNLHRVFWLRYVNSASYQVSQLNIRYSYPDLHVIFFCSPYFSIILGKTPWIVGNRNFMVLFLF